MSGETRRRGGDVWGPEVGGEREKVCFPPVSGSFPPSITDVVSMLYFVVSYRYNVQRRIRYFDFEIRPLIQVKIRGSLVYRSHVSIMYLHCLTTTYLKLHYACI